jgi:8-oxo-dGTP diphosphatase
MGKLTNMTFDRDTFAEARLAVDVVILTVRHGELQALLVERGTEPYKGRLALPGGFLRELENLDQAAARALTEGTGLAIASPHLEQLRTYGDPGRDPRGRTISVAYLCLMPHIHPLRVTGPEVRDGRWTPAQHYTAPDSLAFDHAEILAEGVERARSKLEYTTLATEFCPTEFTMGELRNVYEVVWGLQLDPRNFSRKVTKTEGFVVPTGDRKPLPTGRPAALYTRGGATSLYPPMLRSDRDN